MNLKRFRNIEKDNIGSLRLIVGNVALVGGLQHGVNDRREWGGVALADQCRSFDQSNKALKKKGKLIANFVSFFIQF
jgi:hypothetical protein